MNGNCHFMFGASVGTCACLMLQTSPAVSVLAITSCLIGSVFPDIDNPNSSFGHMTKPVSTAIGAVSKVFGKTEGNHRGIFHDIGFHAIGFICSVMYFPALMFFFMGTLSHLFLDMFNYAGVPVFLVLKARLAKIKSGSKESIVLSALMSIMSVGIGFTYQYI